MINKSVMEITVFDKGEQKNIFFGQFNVDDIKEIIYIAQKHNMQCLKFIDPFGCTFFDYTQCEDIKKELAILKSYDFFSKDLLDYLLRAADFIREEKSSCYLKFKGLK